MCKSKNRSDGIEPEPNPNSTPQSSRTPKFSETPKRFTSTSTTSSSSSSINNVDVTSNSYNIYSSSSSSSTPSYLSGFRSSFPQNPLIFHLSEISSATTNFLAGKLSSSSSSSSAARAWRCCLRGQDVVVFQRKFNFQINPSHLYKQISLISRAHHNSLIKLVGSSISGDYLYLVYEYIQGINLANCLRNPRNPSYTVLSTWISRIQIATDLAHGLDYIHNFASLNSRSIHNRIKSSSVIVTESSLRGKLCHFGTADLIGENGLDRRNREMNSVSETKRDLNSRGSESQSKRFEGTMGYMSPEFKSGGVGSRESDVFAFGVVMLELISGEEPLKFEFDERTGCYRRIAVIDSAREAADFGGDHGGDGGGRLRRWVDWRLKDSFPVGVARELTRVALECVDVDPTRRPGMGRVAGKISKLYMESKIWADTIGVASDVTVSLAPR